MQVTWPLVALVGLVLAAIVGILALVPESDAQARAVVMVIVQALVVILTGLWTARRVENSVRDQNTPDQNTPPEQDNDTDPPAPGS